MKRVYKLEGLDCADCTAKRERAIAKLQGVYSKAGAGCGDNCITVDLPDKIRNLYLLKYKFVDKKDIKCCVLKFNIARCYYFNFKTDADRQFRYL